MLASVMLLKPALLLADEPTTALDAVVQRDVMELMVDLTKANGTAVLLISHDLGMVARYCSRIVVMCQGDVVEQGTAETSWRGRSTPIPASCSPRCRTAAGPRAAHRRRRRSSRCAASSSTIPAGRASSARGAQARAARHQPRGAGRARSWPWSAARARARPRSASPSPGWSSRPAARSCSTASRSSRARRPIGTTG
jgi:ABC-type glutathione transport system ATPase component